jgi:hypothetical protein
MIGISLLILANESHIILLDSVSARVRGVPSDFVDDLKSEL